MRRLWGRANSANVMKPLWVMEELGLPYERIDVGGPFGKTDTPEYRAMNPVGRIPTLQEDEFTLWESNVIIRYLCAAYAPGNRIWPSDPRARANVDRWMDAQQTVMNAPQSVVFQGLVRTPPERRDNAAIERAMGEADRAWMILNAELGKHPYVAGETFTLADVSWGVHVHRWLNLPLKRSDAPALEAWYQRLLQRPAYAQHCAIELT